MNKLLASVGVLALGTAGLHAAYAPGLSTMETSKPWSLSASLRGFYDDNYTTSPRTVARESFGLEVSPSASLNIPLDQTFIGMSYIYSMRYYEDRARNKADHSHQFNAKLDHAFSERYKVELNESFVIAQEPELLDPSSIRSVFLRTEGDNLRNTASIDFTAQLTQLVGLQLGYNNTIFDYEQRGVGSRSALLDRMEHLATLNLRWQVLRQTVGILGYNFGYVDYTSRDGLFFNTVPSLTLPGGLVSSSIRDNYSHYLYVGADHNFNSQLNGSIRVGGQYTEYSNQGTDSISPYADANMSYAYASGSYLQIGLRHARNQTDVFFPSATNVTQDQESTSFYASVTHRFTGKISGTLLGQYQHSMFNEGGANDQADNFFILGANLAYRISQHWMAETGYNFDRLDSDILGRSYTRNRVYVGIRATY